MTAAHSTEAYVVEETGQRAPSSTMLFTISCGTDSTGTERQYMENDAVVSVTVCAARLATAMGIVQWSMSTQVRYCWADRHSAEPSRYTARVTSREN